MKPIIYAFLVLAAPVLAQESVCEFDDVLCINQAPTRQFGQPTLINAPNINNASPNLVQGQELFNPTAIAFDTSVSPPHVYVVDTGNNRVLGWSNANSLNLGNFADLVLGQQASASGGFDFTATLQLGPGTNLSTGLNTPTGIAVDAAGNVYVSDSLNNRVVRFKSPYKQQPGNLIVDLVIGQKGVSSGNQANQGQQSPTSSSLSLAIGSQSGQIIATGLAIDSSGNLYVADPGNNRVLMFQAANLTAGGGLPVASVALGQTNFSSGQQINPSQTNKSLLAAPSGVAVDSQGTVYVTDEYARVLVFPGPVSLGQSASTILGLPPTPTQQNPNVIYPSQYSLGAVSSGGGIIGTPEGVFILTDSGGTHVFVCDSPQNRVVRYDSLVVPSNANSPIQDGAFGQGGSYVSGSANLGQTTPTNATFSNPVAGVIRPDNSQMWIVDQANHRVLAFNSQGGGVYNTASVVLGQKDFIYNGANLLEGREVWFGGGGGMAVDSTSCSAPPNVVCSSAPYLYIADTENNRVLGFKDARSVGVDSRHQLSQTADLVIGQADLLHNIPNYSPTNNSTSNSGPSATGLSLPVGLAVDKHGNLWVADSGNGRVIRFPAPFAQPSGSVQTATVVLGQNDLVSVNQTVSKFNMTQPFGLALLADGNLAVSDLKENRVLVFDPNGADFTSGMGASFVLGQSSFTQNIAGASGSQLNSPRHIAGDSSSRLYVGDYNNSRLLVFPEPSSSTPTGATAAVNIPVGQPEGIIVSPATGLSWITSGNTVFQLPEYLTLQATQTPTQELTPLTLANGAAAGPLAVTLDPFDDVIVADSTNRVTFYFGQAYYRNTASYAGGLGTGTTAGPSPTMLIYLAREGLNFQFQTSYAAGQAANLNTPWPLQLNNVQVAVNGIPAPIFRIDSNIVNVEIPNEAPSAGPADFVVSNPATGQILGVGTFTMQAASPGFYAANQQGTGAIVASNYDATGQIYMGINGPSNPVVHGGVLGLWLTGVGNIASLPVDGTAPGGSQTAPNPTVLFPGVNGNTPAQIVGSAMSPQYPGLWQVNIVVPADTPASTVSPIPIYIELSLDGYASNVGGTNNPDGSPGADRQLTGNAGNGLLTYIYVK